MLQTRQQKEGSSRLLEAAHRFMGTRRTRQNCPKGPGAKFPPPKPTLAPHPTSSRSSAEAVASWSTSTPLGSDGSTVGSLKVT